MQKQIYCHFVLFMPTPQMSCIQLQEIIKESQQSAPNSPKAQQKRQMFDSHCEQRRFSEAEVLKNIMKLPEGLLRHNARRVAGYRNVPE